ncbi:MAG: autotransporter outer membrane beta-barrel domain-containing protein [Chlamydiia bacterium]
MGLEFTLFRGFVKQILWCSLSSLLLISKTLDASTPFGIIGGFINSNGEIPYAGFVYSDNLITNIAISPTFINGEINSVSMNSSGFALLGGKGTSTTDAYFAYVSTLGTLNETNLGLTNGQINQVALNSAGLGLIGGADNGSQLAYAAAMSPSFQITPLSLPSGFGSAVTVALNSSGYGLIGGRDATFNAPFAVRITPNLNVETLILTPTLGNIAGSALNDVGQGVLVGLSDPTPYVVMVDPNGTIREIPPTLTQGGLYEVAINSNGKIIIGGTDGTYHYAAFMTFDGTESPLAVGQNLGEIITVAINSSGYGLIGGNIENDPYAAIVTPEGAVQPLNLNNLPTVVRSVKLNEFGQGIIGGYNKTLVTAYAAMVFLDGTVTPLNLGFTEGAIISVGIPQLPVAVPSTNLTGNNLIFANYINEYAPQVVAYFVPSLLDNTLASALEYAAVTRNAASLFTATNNTFFLSTTVSSYLRRHDFSTNERMSSKKVAKSKQDQYVADLNAPKPKEIIREKNTFWAEAIGAFAYQRAQNETPAFNPSSGGMILGIDRQFNDYFLAGIGFSYLFTYIHEKQNMGHSSINQEEFFIYGNCNYANLYLDGSVQGGIFQISQIRNIQITGFNFQSTSSPSGGNLIPHLELGYNYDKPEPIQNISIRLNPFVMVDWANAWQSAYTETGVGPFNAGQFSHYSALLRTEVGLRLYETWNLNSWNLTLQEKGSYVNVLVNNVGKVNAFLVGSPGSFTVETLNRPQNLGVVQVLASFHPVNAKKWIPGITAFYQGEFGSAYFSNQVNLGAHWSF